MTHLTYTISDSVAVVILSNRLRNRLSSQVLSDFSALWGPTFAVQGGGSPASQRLGGRGIETLSRHRAEECWHREDNRT